ncbi:unnamed protein product [Gongylonema pulchrum]|uniref:Transcriptional regulator n=1 Tax=Gongylonema pulchrum TaxID=637853 RepID=A0A183DE40_9BILA|nr:unnamed protein product [Gongylonema pulchrum]
MRGGRGDASSAGRGRGSEAFLSEQISALNIDDNTAEGYGCPPSYVLESYRDQAETVAGVSQHTRGFGTVAG